MEATGAGGVSRAVSLLQEVTQLLVAETDCSSTTPANAARLHPTTSSVTTQQPRVTVSRPAATAVSCHASGPSTASGLGSSNGNTSTSTRRTPSVVSPTSRQLNILQSFSGLFSPYNRPSSRLPSNPGPSSSGQSRSVFQPPRPSKRGRFVPKETWTHDFFLLSMKPCSNECST